MQIIARTYYYDKIIPFIDKGLIKVLVGQRRVGKSCVMQSIAHEITKRNKNSNIIFINKEDFSFDFINNAKELVDYVEAKISVTKRNYLFIDEIQDIEEFEKALRSFQAKNQCDIFCSGSNAKMLSSELATYLAGRYIEFKIQSLNYKEFLFFHQLEDSDLNFIKFVSFGGMPHLTHLGLNPDLCNEYLKNLFNSIVLKDIISREKIRNIFFLEKLLKFSADNLGSLLSALGISKYLKAQKIVVNPSVVLNYLHHLCYAFILNKVSRFDVQGKKVFENNEKYYFEDLGLRNALIGLDLTKDIHKLLENVVFNQLQILGYKIYIGRNEDKEIDFVASKNDETIYFQVCYLISDEKTHQREFGNLLQIKDNYRKIVISMDQTASGNHQGVEHWQIRNFLLNFEIE